MATMYCDDDMPDALERQRFAALASARMKQRECDSLRKSAAAVSAAWQSAEADLAHLRSIIESLDHVDDGSPVLHVPATTHTDAAVPTAA